MSSEAPSRLKFDSLPGIDTEPDVYETPDLAEDVSTLPASTALSESDYSDADPDSSAVNHRRLQTDAARSHFEPTRVDANGVDFSDNIAQKQAYRTYTRQRRRGELLGDEDSDEERESFARKLMRLKREAQELEDEYEQRKQAGDKTQIEERDAREVMELISDKVDKVYAARRGGAGAEPLLDRTIQKFNGYEPFGQSKTITAAIANQPPLPGTQIQTSQLERVLAQAADFDARIAQMELSLGLSGAALPEMGEDSTHPVLSTLDRLDQTLVAIGSAAGNTLADASQHVKSLIADAEALKQARLEAEESGDAAPPSEQESKINALYGTLPSIEKLAPALPLVLERLRSLRLVHTSAAAADEVLSELEARQSKQEEEIRNWEKQLEMVEQDVKKHEEVLKGNVKVVGDDVKMIEEKIAKLMAEGRD